MGTTLCTTLILFNGGGGGGRATVLAREVVGGKYLTLMNNVKKSKVKFLADQKKITVSFFDRYCP